jgi:uncharacterized protein YeaO (DUF488 family)
MLLNSREMYVSGVGDGPPERSEPVSGSRSQLPRFGFGVSMARRGAPRIPLGFISAMPVQVKRLHDDPTPADGFRILVDRLWPRGVSKERAAIDLWLKEVAPSSELRTWFDHRPDRFADFAIRYAGELDSNPAVDQLLGIVASNSAVTLLYGAKDKVVNHAVVLADYLAR